MSTCNISELPHLTEIAPNVDAFGFTHDFSELFGRPEIQFVQVDPQAPKIEKRGILVFRPQDPKELASNPAIGMVPAEYLKFSSFFATSIFTMNPPIHGAMRRLISRPFAPKYMPRLREGATNVAENLLGQVIGQGDIDFYSEFSLPFTATFWGRLLDFTKEETLLLIDLMHHMSPAFLIGCTTEEESAAEAALNKYMDLISHAAQRALARGGSDTLQCLASVFGEFELSGEPYLLGEAIAANVIDGIHTVAVAATNALFQLLISPVELSAVRGNHRLIQNAVSEGMRLWPPIVSLDRFALQDVALHGVMIPAGTIISMLWAAGNRDPAAFQRPNQFDIFRTERRITTFGGGAHVCPGRHVAHLLMQVMLEVILSPEVGIELNEYPPDWAASRSTRQLTSLRVALSSRENTGSRH